jgi:DNA-binding FadR family transcriptional regulator
VANSSLDLTDRAVLEPLARLLAAARKAAGDAPILLRLVAQMPPGDRDRQLSFVTAFYTGLFEAGGGPSGGFPVS